MADTTPCTAAIQEGRLAKARQFLLAAETIHSALDDQQVADAYVTLCVHAAIAAADVICCARLGVHHHGESHGAAVALLRRVDEAAAKNLKRMLDMKTRSAYGASPTSRTDQVRARRAAAALVHTAQSV